MKKDDIATVVESLGGLLAILRDAEPVDKAEIYRQMRLKLTYDYENRLLLAKAEPKLSVYSVVVSEGGRTL